MRHQITKPHLSSSKLDGRSDHHFTLLPRLPLFKKTPLASPSSCSSFLQENPNSLLPLFFSPKEGKVSASMVLLYFCSSHLLQPRDRSKLPLCSSFGFLIIVFFPFIS